MPALGGNLHGRKQTFYLYSWSFLSAAAGESVAGDGRDAGHGGALPRLERAHLRGVLRDQRRGADPEQQEPDHAHCEQLRAHELQLRAHAAELAEGECAADLSHDPGRRAAQPEELWRTQLGDGAGVQPHHYAAGEQARPDHADPLGDCRLRTALRRAAGGDVAGGDSGGHGIAGADGAARHQVHGAGAAPVQAHPATEGRRGLDGYAGDDGGHHAPLLGALRLRSLDWGVLLQ